MSDTTGSTAGVPHDDTVEVVARVCDAVPGCDWNRVTGQSRWFMLTLLLALPFPARVLVRPDAQKPVYM